MFTAIEPGGVRLADGGFLAADVILWATGFRAELEHLAPLHLRSPGGGIAMDGTQVAAEPRVHLVGYGPSSSTIGANRAGRAAVTGILRMFAEQDKLGTGPGPEGSSTPGPDQKMRA
jgi:NADH dehydrogenase FAD-containing subunit